jgi:hypothetical protein
MAHVYGRVLGLYRAEFRSLIALAALVFIPVGLAKAVPIEIEAGEVSVLEGLLLFAVFMAELAIIFVGIVFYAGAVGGLVAGNRTSLWTLLRRLPYLRLAAIDVIFTVGTFVGLGLLIVPGVVFLTWYCLSAPVAEIEHRRVLDAMRRSRQLVRGHFREVAAAVVPLWVLTVLVETGLSELLGEGLPTEWLATTTALMLTSPLFALTVADLTVELAK